MSDRLERYAELAVRVGANVQPGQEVFVQGLVEHAELVRALTRQSYRAGASFVNVAYLVVILGALLLQKGRLSRAMDNVTSSWNATLALRMRVNMSATGSFVIFSHQLLFLMPGIKPIPANSLKQIRQRPNFRMNARGRPHSSQRLCCCTRNFGGRLDLTIMLVLANALLS